MGLTALQSNKLNELKRDVLRRFKNQKYHSLNEELKNCNHKDKNTLTLLNAQIRALKYNPNLDGDNIKNVEDIESIAKNLIEELKERSKRLINEEDEESTMLCELQVRNLITFLKHFNLKINFDDHGDENKNENNENDRNKETIRILNDRCFVLQHNLTLKVTSMIFFILNCNN